MYTTPYDTRLFAEVYDFHPQAIIWMRPIPDDLGNPADFEYGYSNEEGLKYLNLPRESFEGLKLSTSPTLSGELREYIKKQLIHVYTTGKRWESSVFNDVLKKHTKVLFSRLRDGVLVVVQDTTREKEIIRQLKQQKKELQEQKTLLDNILENSSNGISVSQVFRDENGKVIDALTILANEAAVNYIGFPREVYLTKKATEIEPAVMTSPYYQACIHTLETGEPFVMQYYMESTKRWLELTVSKLDYDHLIQIFTDVTPVKEVQLQLEKAVGTLRTVFDAAQTGMFTFAPEYNDAGEITDFRFVMVNSTIAAFAGIPAAELEGSAGTKWFPGYLTNGEFDLYKKCYESGDPQRMEICFTREDHDYYLDLQCVRIEGQLLVTLTDQSSLRKSQLELEQTVRALERSNTSLEDFAHAASHDMKEPLRKIRTFATRLKGALDDRMSQTEHDLFDRIEVSAERMQLLVDDLLEFSRVSEKEQLWEEVNLTEKIERVLSDLELAMEEKKATLHMDRLPTVMGNRRQLQQLFHNLLSNALKYSKPGVAPLISIRSRVVDAASLPAGVSLEKTEGSYHLIEVEDNGIGFEQKYAEQIFKMFQRLHGKSEYSGTGVGLSIARKVAENHGGAIWAESEPDKGTIFNIVLPARI